MNGVFLIRGGLHFIHRNINSLLPKIDELRNIAGTSNAAVIGVGESKLDDSVLSSEILFAVIGTDIGRGSLLYKERCKLLH